MYISLDFFAEKKETTSREMVIPGSSQTIKPLKAPGTMDGIITTPTNSRISTRYIYKCPNCKKILRLQKEPATLFTTCPRCNSSKMAAKAIDVNNMEYQQVYRSSVLL